MTVWVVEQGDYEAREVRFVAESLETAVHALKTGSVDSLAAKVERWEEIIEEDEDEGSFAIGGWVDGRRYWWTMTPHDVVGP